MRVLKVIHGYPPRYSAGSEVYTQTLCQGLSHNGHEVAVFAREEDPYKVEYTVSKESDGDVETYLINKAHCRDRYIHDRVDDAFANLIDQFQPDIVHFGHLNHLSMSMVGAAKSKEIPIVFTLHDFWLMCPRGQFLQQINSLSNDLYPVCEKQDNRKCASSCYWRYFSGAATEVDEDMDYWTHWIERRMAKSRSICQLIDAFIAPSKYLENRFVKEFGLGSEKVHYIDYGFDLERLKGRVRKNEEGFVFGYIGTHRQAKGIHNLIDAFLQLKGDIKLRIWGSPQALFTDSLKKKTANDHRIEWMGGYVNQDIVEDVFNHVDTIVTPSIWGENSPLVIHESLQAGVPTITADYGGMREYIHHETNGLLFEHRSVGALAKQMQRFVDCPEFAQQLARRGYLQSEDGNIPSLQDHLIAIESLYKEVMNETRAMAHHI